MRFLGFSVVNRYIPARFGLQQLWQLDLSSEMEHLFDGLTRTSEKIGKYQKNPKNPKNQKICTKTYWIFLDLGPLKKTIAMSQFE